MEEIQPDDHVAMATVDMNMTSSVSVTKNDAMTSPELSRKRGGKKSRQHHQVFAHEGCVSVWHIPIAANIAIVDSKSRKSSKTFNNLLLDQLNITLLTVLILI